MTEKELILNFTDQYNRPFTVETVASLTNVSIITAQPVLEELITKDKIKKIDDNPPIYVRTNRFNTKIGYQHYKGWTFDLMAAHQLLDTLEGGRFKSIRDIAQVVGKSRQWVYIYLEALASIEVVDLRGFIYVVNSRLRGNDLGKHIMQKSLRERSMDAKQGLRFIPPTPVQEQKKR